MRERINRLARGFVEYGNCDVQFSCQEIRETVAAGKKDRGEFRIYNHENILLKGLVYSTDRRVKLKNDQFGGTGCLISYDVDASRDASGTIIQGEFQIVSNFGEFTIPYSFFVITGENEIIGRLTTPEAFAEFAGKSRDMALRLFDSDLFLTLPFMKTPELRALYDGLIRRGSKRNAMEEFLTGSGLKEQCRLFADVKQRRYFEETLPEAEIITITRSSWGYVKLEVESDCDFLVPEQPVITEEDFEENVCRFRVFLDKGKLHPGSNMGRLTLKNIYQSFSVPFYVEGLRRADQRELRVHENWISYRKNYLNLLAGNGEDKRLLAEMQSALSFIRENSRAGDMTELLHAEVYLLQGNRDQVGLLLEDVRSRINLDSEDQVDVASYYRYLHAMYTQDPTEKRELLQLLNRLSENPMTASDTVMLLLFRLDVTLQENPSLELTLLKTQYRRGCRNELMYLEACRIFNIHPELLRVLDGFEVQTIWFGVKKGRVNNRLARATAALAGQEKESGRLYYISLATLYKKYLDPEILTGLCALLMRADCRSEEYFRWYELGVEKDVRLTRLYEYYLYSLPENFDGKIPRMVLLYFTYNNTLDYVTQARLYAYLLQHAGEDPQMDEVYRKPMEEFVREQMLSGHMNDDLAVLYDHFLYPALIDDKMGRMLPRLLYANHFTCDNPEVRYLILVHPELREETVLPLKNGQAYISLYLKNTRILTQDAYGNRYEGISVAQVRLMESPELEKLCREKCPDHWMMALSDAVDALDSKDSQGRWVRKIMAFRGRTELHPLFRARVTSELLRYYEDHTDERGLADFLLGLNPEVASGEDRIRIIEMLVEMEYFREAYDMAMRFGYEGVRPARLMRLCNRMILDRNMEKEEGLLDMAFACFQNKRADAVIMQYLCRYFNGSSRDMFLVLLNGQEVQAGTYDLEERLLGQMLFAGTEENLDDTFRAYASRPTCDETLVTAYLVVKSYRCFLGKIPIGDDLSQYMKNVLRRRGNVEFLPAVCLMALSWNDSLQTTLSGDDCELLAGMVDSLYHRNYVFAYFKNLARFIRLPDELGDKVIVEYRGERNGRIQIRTRIAPGGEVQPAHTMPHIYEGVFVQLATVFYGETLEYEIIDLNQDGKVVEKSTAPGGQEGRFGKTSRIAMMNRILQCLKTDNAEELRNSLLDYGAMDELVKDVFKAI